MAFSQFGTSSDARRKRVYYAGTSTIAEGMPLCYDYDTTDNILGYDKGAGGDVTSQTTPETTAEGNQNEGKLMQVEDPALNNIKFFAGVVAGNSYAGLTGPRWLDIYVPNGAIVPVKTVLAATVVGKTLLAVNSGTLTLGNPTMDIPDFATTSSGDTAGTIDARIVAVAEETISSAGLVLACLCPEQFTYQGGQIDGEMQIAAGTVNATVNRSMIEFLSTSGHCQALHYRTLLTGNGTVVGDGQRGVYRFETFTASPIPEGKYLLGLHSQLELGADFSAGTGGGHAAPLALTVRTKNTNPDLSNIGELAAIHIEWHLRKTTTGVLDNPPDANKTSIIYINTDSTASQPSQLLKTERPSDFGGYLSSGDAPALQTGDLMIPIIVGGVRYYMVGLLDTGI